MSLRTERVASLLKEEVGTYLTREFRDPGYGFVTVTDVQVSPDLRIAKIHVSIMGNDAVRKKTLEALDERSPEIRSFIGSHMRLKFTPEVHWYLDTTLDQVEKIDRLLKQIHDSERK